MGSKSNKKAARRRAQHNVEGNPVEEGQTKSIEEIAAEMDKIARMYNISSGESGRAGIKRKHPRKIEGN